MKFGAVCPGYPGKKPLEWRESSKVTEARAQKLYLAKNSEQEAAIQSQQLRGRSEDGKSDVQPLDFLRLSFHKDAIIVGSVSAYFQQWNNARPEFLESNFISATDLYPACDGTLKAAIETLAFWNLLLTQQNTQIDVKTSMMVVYNKTLRQISNALAQLAEQNLDQILLAIEFLSVFEALVQPDNNLVRSGAHIRGMLAMMAHRGPDQFVSGVERRLCLDAIFVAISGLIVYPNPEPLPLDPTVLEALSRSEFAQSPQFKLLPTGAES